ncbi:leucine-rich repeat-containing protein, conserved [Candida dubliniensis CD36]|uniref:Leucine-rich repeat-containing protein, conserved n=1 Tax=Candida dubliniensis (strain CD36 / ATCC MYA-646 / CBS 7987 / NCPF 3949 / NRRL Y-17841) TaxID=573826 RepID=B9WAE0_CANDC|nr:leucine-rich repeat-containing protein, conserved [Candida dubliniensis CD36]CAX43359.1 leucine-rich repeat-containing protein, conserved [Candida dubliniensis CD36]
MILFQLPVELIQKVLSKLSNKELQHYFNIEGLLATTTDQITNSSYLPIRLIALSVYFYNKSVIISNTVGEHYKHVQKHNTDIYVSLDHLQSLSINNFIIRPRQIFIYITDDTDQNSCGCPLNLSHISFIHKLSQLLPVMMSQYCYRSDTKVNLSISLSTTEDLNSLYDLLHTIKTFQKLSIKYTAKETLDIASEPLQDLQIDTLELQFFNQYRLIDNLQANNNQLLSINHLQLSYNSISSLYFFPCYSNLKSLNLSNNNLVCINNHNFNWGNLYNLEVLDLSNNNIIEINLTNRRNTRNYKLRSLNLSTNNLRTLPNFQQCKFFENLQDLNLSRNAITQLSIKSFPNYLETLWLKGNYLSQLIDELNGEVFPKLLQFLDLTYCKIISLDRDYRYQATVIEKLISVEKLNNLKVLQLEF